MELNVMERLLILNLDTLPKVGNIVTLKIKSNLIKSVGFTEEEIVDFGIVVEDSGNVTWKNSDNTKEIEVGPEAVKLLVTALETSDSLNDTYVPLYDRLKAIV